MDPWKYRPTRVPQRNTHATREHTAVQPAELLELARAQSDRDVWSLATEVELLAAGAGDPAPAIDALLAHERFSPQVMGTLQRQLTAEGTSYSELLERMQESVAMDHMSNTHLSLAEVAFLVGFSDQSNFSKAFKRWTGRTPGDYRGN